MNTHVILQLLNLLLAKQGAKVLLVCITIIILLVGYVVISSIPQSREQRPTFIPVPATPPPKILAMDLSDLSRKGVELSQAVEEVRGMFPPIDIKAYTNLDTPFEGSSDFRPTGDPLKPQRAISKVNALYQGMLTQAQQKRTQINSEIASSGHSRGDQAPIELTLKNLEGIMAGAQGEIQALREFLRNREREEDVAADEIGRDRNRENAIKAGKAEEGLQEQMRRAGW